MKLVGVALVIFASLKVADPVLQKTLIEYGIGLFGAGGAAYIIGRSVRKIGQPVVVEPVKPPADDKAAAAVVAGP